MANSSEKLEPHGKRRLGFNFDQFKTSCPGSSKNPIPNNWLEWFVGYFEGDGTFISRNKSFTFCIYSIHKDCLEEIKLTLGFGTINYNKEHNKYTYLVEKRENIFLLLTILNGNLVLNHRFDQFIKVANDFNIKLFRGKDSPNKLIISSEKVLPGINDAWLSGFIDAEGHFGLPIEKGRKFIPYYISITFEIGQNGEEWLFYHLKDIFKGGIVKISKYKEEHSPRSHAKNINHSRIIFKGIKLGKNPVTLLFDYFDKYPIKVKKRIYDEWRDIHKSLLNKDHLNPLKLSKLVLRSEKLNDR